MNKNKLLRSMTKTDQKIYIIILLLSPFIAYALTLLLPTFDDWNALTSPNDDPEYWKYLLPNGNFWRPIDAAWGYLVGSDLKLFPALNHIIIYIGHLVGALMVYVITRRLRLRPLATTIATLFYLVAPTMLGVLMDVDSINQTFAAVFGLIGLYIYLGRGRYSTAWWIVFSLMATMAKENGMMWLVAAPIVAASFHTIDRRTLWRHIMMGVAAGAAYWAVRLSLPHYDAMQDNGYLDVDNMRRMVNVAKFGLFTLFSFDFVSVFHKPSRNIVLLIFTAALSLPWMITMMGRMVKTDVRHTVLGLVVAIVLLVAPHLATIFSVMHAYAPLGVTALLVGYIIDRSAQQDRWLKTAFSLYVASALIVDVRHYVATYRSGLIGYDMAQQVIAQTKKPTHKAFVINIDQGEKKYSTFCVIPYEAFGWGLSVRYHTNYQWPQLLRDEAIPLAEAQRHLPAMIAEKFKEGYDHVWIVKGTKVEVVER